jgi:hypothetical protein
VVTVEQEYAGLLTSTANRLRLVQVDFADQADEVRQQYLRQELNRALATIPPNKRQAFTEALGRQFPTWDGAAPNTGTARDGVAMDQSAFDKSELNDPSFLVSRLIALAPNMADGVRHALIEKLRAAGLGAPSTGGWSEQSAAPLRAKLQFNAQQVLDADRTVELLDLLTDFVANLDQLVWATWRQLAADSRIKRPNPLLRVLRAFMTRDANVPQTVLAQDIGALRQLTAALINAVGQVGYTFAARHTEKLSPALIEDAVKAEGRGGIPWIGGGAKAACWEKYLQLSNSLDAAAIEKEINTVIAESVEQLTRGLVR